METKKVRSSQLLTPFGVGQIINFPKEVSVMVGGLDLWDENIKRRKAQVGIQKIDESALRIIEPRLQNLLQVEYFIKPFQHTTSGLKNNHLLIPAFRFPKWHYCTNSRCGRMREVEIGLADEKVECTACFKQGDKFKSKMIPVRFIAACPKGHIQDVPFKEWVHNGPVPNDDKEHFLSYQSLSGSGDLGSILIKCSCGEKKTLAGLMNIRKNGDEIFDSALARVGYPKNSKEKFSEENKNDNNPSGQYCKGHRPWLGLEGINNASKCGNHLQVLIRGGSNVHYANIISALHLPEVSSEADEFVAEVIKRNGKERLKMFYEQDNGTVILPLFLESEQVVQKGLISKEELLEGVISELNQDTSEREEISSEKDLRLEEYKYILEGHNSENTSFKAIKTNFNNYDGKDFLEEYFECVVLIEKLKETRVFQGFSRIDPGNNVDKSELSNKPVNWLPGIEVYGEGIFLKFNDDKIDVWEQNYGNRFSKVINRYHDAMLRRRPAENPRQLSSTFLMMHTFAHLLIKRLCFNCGYGSSSLRERIYFNRSRENRMNGILIYTSSGDSEGSLGGLVRQGKKNHLGKLIRDAINDSQWCSADPVCSDIGQSSGQGPDNINGSACHNCCIVPETSCEEFNMLLDRATITGTIDEDIGFFEKE